MHDVILSLTPFTHAAGVTYEIVELTDGWANRQIQDMKL